MAGAPDTLIDKAKVIVARAATAGPSRRHKANFPYHSLPPLDDLTCPSLRPPAQMEPRENGYLVALNISRSLPPESFTESNSAHRTLQLLSTLCDREVDAGRRALQRYQAPMDELVDALEKYPKWQTPPPNENVELPELSSFKRLGHALVLRSTVKFCSKDEQGAVRDMAAALMLARRIRSCQGFMLHLMAGVALDVVVLRMLRRMLAVPRTREFGLICLKDLTLQGRKAEVTEAFRSEFACVCIPRALFYVRPWKRAPAGSPPWYEFPNLAAQLALSQHPEPYNPLDTVAELTSIGEVFLAWIDEGWSIAPAIEEMRQNYAAGWPEELAASPIARQKIPFAAIAKARTGLQGVANPYGRLLCARTLYDALNVYRAALLGELRAGCTLVDAAAVRLGRAPSCLEELVGNGHLKSVPIDPFTDSPLAYDSGDGAVWSPGPNGFTYAEAKRCACSHHDSPYWQKL